jgi:hypothetical protein
VRTLDWHLRPVLLDAGAQNTEWQRSQERAVFSPLPASWEAVRIAGKSLTTEMALRAVTPTGACRHDVYTHVSSFEVCASHMMRHVSATIQRLERANKEGCVHVLMRSISIS